MLVLVLVGADFENLRAKESLILIQILLSNRKAFEGITLVFGPLKELAAFLQRTVVAVLHILKRLGVV